MKAARYWRGRLSSVDPVTVDIVLALGLSLATVVEWWAGVHPLWELPVRLVLAGSVLARRRYPTITFTVAIACAIVAPIGAAGILALGVDSYSAGAYGTSRWRSLLILPAGGVAFFREWSAFLLVVMAWLVGDAVRQRRVAQAALERERAAGDRGALAERARIARDLHDVVAHAVSVIVVQAEGAKNMLQRDPARTGEAIDAISASGREALGELRQLLQVLGSNDDAAPLAPAPTVSDIDQLVERVRAAGQPVEFRIEGKPRPLQPAVSQAAYRILQEALTNAVRYARGAPTRIVVDYGGDGLRLEVVDHGGEEPDGPGSGAGSGLRGLRERVMVFGGDFSAGATGDGGFAVRATLPWNGR